MTSETGTGDENGGIATRIGNWSVVLLGLLLAAVSITGGTLTDTGHAVAQGGVPLIASVAIVSGGVWLRRTDLSPADVGVVARWIVVTVVGLGAVLGAAAVSMATDPIPVWTLVASFTVPIAAAGGGIAGYIDARRRQQHRRMRGTERALETATDGIAILNENEEYVTVNQAHADVYGYDDPEAMVGQSWRTCYHDAEADRIADEVFPPLLEQGEWRGEATGTRADGSTFPQELTLTRMDDGGIVCIVRDITERREQDVQLREQKRQLETIVENAPILLFAFDTDGTFTLSEGNRLASVGLKPGEAVGQSVYDLYGDFPDIIDGCEAAIDGEEVHRTLDLETVVFEVWMSPVTDGSGSVTQVIGTAMDVTESREQKRRIAALHETSRRLTEARGLDEVAGAAVEIVDEVLDRPLSALWTYDAAADALRLVESNDEMAALVDDAGVAFQEIGPDSVAMDTFREGEIRVVDDYRSFDRAAVPGLDMGTVVLLPIGDHGLLHVGQREVAGIDETERTQLEILRLNLMAAMDRAERDRLLDERTEELEVRSTQMEFINSILRHDLFNAMTVIRARGEHLASVLDGDEATHADTIVRWCDDVTAFVQRVQRVLDALGEGNVTSHPVDASALVREEFDRLAQTYPEVEFETSLPESACVLADELLGDVIGNVARNAVDHNDPEGLRIAASVDTGPESTTIRIADDGRGIDPGLREAVFRRGESHAKSTGSGFGLFFVDAMVDAYGGEVHVEDAEPGAAFVIEIPTAVGNGTGGDTPGDANESGEHDGDENDGPARGEWSATGRDGPKSETE